MSATLQTDTAVKYANQVCSLVQQLQGVLANVEALAAINAANPLSSNFWNLLNTTALAADGSLGTADGTPNTAHDIDPRVYAALARAVSATQLTQALQVLVDFNAFCQGTAVAANASRPAQINAVAM